MINLISASSSIVNLSLKESLPAGWTQSNYKFTVIEPVSNSQKVFYPSATETGYIWSRFTISVGTPESSMTASSPTIDLAPGLFEYRVHDTISGLTLSVGMLTVHENKVQTPSISRTKDVKTYKR